MKDRSNKGLAQKLKVVMAVVLICVGTWQISYSLWNIYTGIIIEVDRYYIVQMLGHALMIIGGFILYFMKKLETRIIIGTAGIIIGVSEIVSSSVSVASALAAYNGFITIALVATTGIIPVTNFFLILFSIRYIMGNRRNAIRMATLVALPLISCLVAILGIIMLCIYGFAAQMLYLIFIFLPVLVLYAIFLWFLLLPSVREDFSEWKVYDLSVEMYESSKADPKSSVFREDLAEFVGTIGDVTKWEDSKDIPDCKECSLIFGKDMHLKRLTLRKVDGTDKIRASVISAEAKEYIQGTRFNFREIVPVKGEFDSCQLIRIFGEDGFFMDMNVRDDNPVPKKTYLIDRLIDRISFKSETEKK